MLSIHLKGGCKTLEDVMAIAPLNGFISSIKKHPHCDVRVFFIALL
jgi:hypothetical protein